MTDQYEDRQLVSAITSSWSLLEVYKMAFGLALRSYVFFLFWDCLGKIPERMEYKWCIHLNINSVQWTELGLKPVGGTKIQLRSGKWMWSEQNGVLWATRPWLVLNHCVDYDFLFTSACIFTLFVFQAEAVPHFFALFCCMGLLTPQCKTDG